jgi:hypothetical protein
MSEPTVFYPAPVPTVGRIVHYTLTEQDVERVRAGRFATAANEVGVGDTFAAVVVRIWSQFPEPQCNLQVLLDGPDTLWVTSSKQGTKPGTWAWPPRVG